MEITIWDKLLVSVLIAGLIGTIIGFLVRKGNDAKVGLGCGLMFPITLAVLIVLQIVIPDVIVITKSNDHWEHEDKAYINSIMFPNTQTSSLSWCTKYIANLTEDPLVYYPVYYGYEDTENLLIKKEPILIEPFSIVHIQDSPTYYFSLPPSQISSKAEYGEIKWALESLSSIVERGGFD